MKSIVIGAVCLAASPALMAKDFHFEYSQQDLMSPQQTQALHERLDQSASAYCRELHNLRNVRAIELCRQELVRITVEEVGHPTLTAYHRADTGQSSRG